MRRLAGLTVVCTALVFASAALTGTAGAAAARLVTVRLTGLNRAGLVVAVPQAELLKVDGFPTLYQGTPVKVSPGTYLIAGEVPTYSTGETLTSQTLVFRKIAIRKTGTIRLNGRDGKQLTVGLTGAQAQDQDLAAGACLANTAAGSGEVEQAAWGGDGVAVYAVPVRSAYVRFSYLSILQSAAGVRYYLVGSAGGGIPSGLNYHQSAAGLAKVTTALRGGVVGSSAMDWSIDSGNSQTFCGSGQAIDFQQPQSWVSYLTPGTWTTQVEAYSEGANQELYRTANLYATRKYLAHASYTDTFGGAVAGPGSDFPAIASADFGYGPSLFDPPVTRGGTICCSRTAVTLRIGRHVVRKQTFSSSCQSCFEATIRQAGWYTLNVTARRWFPGGNTQASLLSPRVAVSFRFHASPRPGNGSWQNLPVTDTSYQPLGLNMDNGAPAGGTTRLVIHVNRPGNAGTATPVYRLKTVRVLVSFNDGKTWQRLATTRVHGIWRAVVHDPATGYVSLRSLVTDVHGDSTEQTVYRAYAVS